MSKTEKITRMFTFFFLQSFSSCCVLPQYLHFMCMIIPFNASRTC